MASRKPIIGLSVGFHDFGDYSGIGHQRPIALAGGVPFVLPRLNGEHLDDALDHVDAVAIGGGRDVQPHLYGQQPHETLGPTDPYRDVFELELVKRALDRELPVLGMCRGIQIVNVALGGTLVQDVGLVAEWKEHPTDRDWHRWKEVERASLEERPEVPDHPRHPMAVEAGSRLHDALGVTEIGVDSFHHQAIGEVASGLVVTGRAPDGVVEVLESPAGEPYVLAAQFELHEEWRVDERFLEVFRGFVAAASET